MSGDRATEMEVKGKKDVSRPGERRGREEPSAAMRGKGEESRQPRSQTVKLCTKREEQESQDDWFVRSSVRSRAALLSSALGSALAYEIRQIDLAERKFTCTGTTWLLEVE